MSDHTSNGDSPDDDKQDFSQQHASGIKKLIVTRRPRYALPARKLSSQKQFGVLRAFAIASGHNSKPVSIQDVASILEMHQNSVSICNPFFTETGLIDKNGHKFCPSKAVMEYSDSAQWDVDNAGLKLKPLILKTWFATALLPRLQFRDVSENEAIKLFAEESGATPEYKTQLVMLIDYLVFSGLITRDKGVLKKVLTDNATADKGDKGKQDKQAQKLGDDEGQKQEPKHDPSMESFQIPIPGKSPALISVPKGLTQADWNMLTTMLDAYIQRLQESDQ